MAEEITQTKPVGIQSFGFGEKPKERAPDINCVVKSLDISMMANSSPLAVYTLLKNGVDTELTASFDDEGKSQSDFTGAIEFKGGIDIMSVKETVDGVETLVNDESAINGRVIVRFFRE
jgi:hypothetical protein